MIAFVAILGAVSLGAVGPAAAPATVASTPTCARPDLFGTISFSLDGTSDYLVSMGGRGPATCIPRDWRYLVTESDGLSPDTSRSTAVESTHSAMRIRFRDSRWTAVDVDSAGHYTISFTVQSWQRTAAGDWLHHKGDDQSFSVPCTAYDGPNDFDTASDQDVIAG